MSETIGQIYRIVLGYWPLVFRSAGILVPALLVVQAAEMWRRLTWPDPEVVDPAASALSLVGFVLWFWTGTLHLVRWHRFTLLQEVRIGWTDVGLGGREWRFLGRLLVLILLIAVAMMPFAAITYAAAFDVPDPGQPIELPAEAAAAWLAATIVIGNAVAAVVLGRFGLVLPATALDHPLRLRESWEATRGRTGPAAAVVFAALAPGLAVNLLAIVVPLPLTIGPLAGTILVALSVALTLLTYALLACALSHVHAAVFGWPTAGASGGA